MITTGLSHKKYLMSGHDGSIGAIMIKNNPNIKSFNIKNDVSNINTFLHLAASIEDERIIESNIIYLQKVVEYCIKNKIKNFVYFSSVSVYGRQNKLDISESSCGNELSLYASSKLFAEAYLKSIANLNVLIIRLPAVLTNKKGTYISSLLVKLKNSEDIVLPNYEKQFNNFIGVDDIMNFIDRYEFYKNYEIINFASVKSQSLKDIVLFLYELISSKSKIYFDDTLKNFYNLNVDKLTLEYKYIPMNYKNSLEKWVEINNER